MNHKEHNNIAIVMEGKDAVNTLTNLLTEVSVGMISVRYTELTTEVYKGKAPDKNSAVLFTTHNGTVTAYPHRLSMGILEHAVKEYGDNIIIEPFKFLCRVAELCNLVTAEKVEAGPHE